MGARTLIFGTMLLAVLALLTGYDGLAIALQSQATAQAAGVGGVHSMIEWMKVLGGLAGMLFGIFGLWIYYRTTIRTKTKEALEATVEIYKQQIDALLLRDEHRERDLKESIAQMAEREKEVAALRARTDLSEVLKGVQLLAQVQTQTLKEAAKDHETLVSTLTMFMKNSEDRYASGIKILTTLIETNTANSAEAVKVSAEAVKAAKENAEFLKTLIAATNAISGRLGGVEDTVEAVAKANDVETGADRSKPGEDRSESPQDRRRRPR